MYIRADVCVRTRLCTRHEAVMCAYMCRNVVPRKETLDRHSLAIFCMVFRYYMIKKLSCLLAEITVKRYYSKHITASVKTIVKRCWNQELTQATLAC